MGQGLELEGHAGGVEAAGQGPEEPGGGARPQVQVEPGAWPGAGGGRPGAGHVARGHAGAQRRDVQHRRPTDAGRAVDAIGGHGRPHAVAGHEHVVA
jgi:hypothetical protein